MSLFLIIETGLLVVAASVRIDHVKGKTSASFIVRYIAEVPTNICACQEANEPKAHCLTAFHYKINFTCTVSLFLKFGIEDRYLSLPLPPFLLYNHLLIAAALPSLSRPSANTTYTDTPARSAPKSSQSDMQREDNSLVARRVHIA